MSLSNSKRILLETKRFSVARTLYCYVRIAGLDGLCVRLRLLLSRERREVATPTSRGAALAYGRVEGGRV
jgi:hypothetical protein